MSLYLRTAIDTGRYLLEAVRVVEVQPAGDPREAVRWQGDELRQLDLRALFGAESARAGYCVLVREAAGATVALVVDGVEGLVEIGQSEWRPLPPIGPLGQLIDAVSTKLAQERPMLRLRVERVASAFSRDTAGNAGSRLTGYR